jgi:hypothetical protein
MVIVLARYSKLSYLRGTGGYFNGRADAKQPLNAPAHRPRGTHGPFVEPVVRCFLLLSYIFLFKVT